jgi:hypothetical protein
MTSVAKRENLAIDHGVVLERSSGGGDFREAFRDQLLAARPQVHVPAALDQLRADAIPLPFRQPRVEILEHGSRRCCRFNRGREVERIRPRQVFIGDAMRTQCVVPVRGRHPIAHQPGRDRRRRQIRRRGQRAHDERLRHPDTELTGEQFQQREPFPSRQPPHPVDDHDLLHLG